MATFVGMATETFAAFAQDVVWATATLVRALKNHELLGYRQFSEGFWRTLAQTFRLQASRASPKTQSSRGARSHSSRVKQGRHGKGATSPAEVFLENVSDGFW